MGGLVTYIRSSLGLGLPQPAEEVRHHSGYFRMVNLQGFTAEPDMWYSEGQRIELCIITMPIEDGAAAWGERFFQTTCSKWTEVQRSVSTLGGLPASVISGVGRVDTDRQFIATLSVKNGRGVGLAYGAKFADFGERKYGRCVIDRFRKGFTWL